MMNRLIYALGGLMGGIMLILALVCALAWYACTPVFPEAVTTQLHAGMRASQARLLLGDPESTKPLKSGRVEWRYSRSLRADFCVEVDSDGTVQYFYEHD
jgi:hypothetical protein